MGERVEPERGGQRQNSQASQAEHRPHVGEVTESEHSHCAQDQASSHQQISAKAKRACSSSPDKTSATARSSRSSARILHRNG